MKRDTVNYALVGAFVVAMIAAFVVLLIAVTGRSGPTDEYYVYYENVAGLKFGTGVFYEGYLVGQIESINPESEIGGMRYKVGLSIASDWDIPVDSIAAVESSGLISAVSIQISEGESKEILEPGGFLEGRGQADIFAALNQAASDFRTLSQEGILPLLNNVNERVSQLSDEIIRFRRDELSPFVGMMHKRIDEDLITEAQSLLEHLDDTARGLNAMVDEGNQRELREILQHTNAVVLNLNTLVDRIETTRLQMTGVLASLGELVTDNQNEMAGAIAAAEASMAELEAAMRTVNQHLGVIMHNAEASSRNMNEFTRNVRDNPSRLIRGSSAAEPGSQ